MVAHPVNPPYLVPLVELAPAAWTSADVVARARDLYLRAGQTPFIVKKEITGFLLNRVQSAVLSEVFALYRDGHADAEDLDRVLKDGLALRWSFMGPFETIDLNAPGGLADYAERFGPTYREVAAEAIAFDWDGDTVDYLWSVLGAGRSQIPIATLSAATGGNVRVGLEDSLWNGPGKLAESNASQVKRIRTVIEALSLEVATPDEVRAMLQLKGRNQVGF